MAANLLTNGSVETDLTDVSATEITDGTDGTNWRDAAGTVV